MRQRFHEQPEPQTTYRATPQQATVTVLPEQQQQRKQKQTPKLKSAKTSTAKKRRGVRRWIVATFAFLLLPWCPPRTGTLAVAPGVGSANAIFDQVADRQSLPWEGKRTSQLSPAELAARDAYYAPYLKAGTPLPAAYVALDSRTTVEGMRMDVQRGKAALALLPQVLQLPYKNLPRISAYASSRTKGRSPIYELARLRTYEGILHAIDGDAAASVDAYLDTIQLGVHVGQGGAIRGGTYQELSLGLALKNFPASVAHLSPEKAAPSAARLEALLAQRAPIERFVERERDQSIQELASFQTGADLSFYSRIPIFRAFNQYVIGSYQTAMNQKLAWLQHPSGDYKQALGEHPAAYDLTAPFQPYSGVSRFYESYTANTEQAQRVLKLLKARAAGRH